MIDTIKKDALDFIKYDKEYEEYLKTLNKISQISKDNINFYIISNGEIVIDDKIKSNLDRIHKFANNFNMIFNIYLILSPFKKTFNKDLNKPLSIININSAYTYLTNNQSIKIICCIRKEEYVKCIYHEIIHHIPLIHKSFKKENIIKLKKHFKILNEKIDPNEAIIEFWALVMFLKELSNNDDNKYYELFKEELKYSLFKCYQINKLQNFYGGYWKDNETNLYCYIIFKTIIMYNLDIFMNIYTFPYDDDKITDFLINYSKLPIVKSNNKKRKLMSLCFMVNSDLF